MRFVLNNLRGKARVSLGLAWISHRILRKLVLAANHANYAN